MALTGPARAADRPDSFADLAERLSPAVVNISTSMVIKGGDGPSLPRFPEGSPFEDFFKEFEDRGQSRRTQSLGSGFIIDASGIVVTNNHVIENADKISVILANDEVFEAELVGRDQKTDIAVLKIDPGQSQLTAVSFGDSDKLRVGDWVMAIGNPFGLGGTVTAGIVSARGRDIGSGPYDDFIQTDASINRGNSGGRFSTWMAMLLALIQRFSRRQGDRLVSDLPFRLIWQHKWFNSFRILAVPAAAG